MHKGDDQLEPVRSQLSVLAPQPNVDYIALWLYASAQQRNILGGTFESGETNLDPDQATIRRVVADHAAFFGSMR